MRLLSFLSNWGRSKYCVKNANCNSTNFKGTVADWILRALYLITEHAYNSLEKDKSN